MRIEKITDYSKPEEGNKFQELAHKIYVGIYLQYYGKDTGILVCKTPKIWKNAMERDGEDS